ncbi:MULTISPECIES: hypothetical protein [Cysteiniphilum]|uniref:hypothetical protein n=1 Tax=Cysteiniphilum TaxID=2056696 RepID=UPI00177EA564|nr:MULTISPECIES: hypothetical protein [Cysteiniphilum]
MTLTKDDLNNPKKMNATQIKKAFCDMLDEIEDFKCKYKEINDVHNDLFAKDPLCGEDFKGIKDCIESTHTEINGYYNKIFKDEEDNLGIKSAIDELKESIESEQKKIHTFINEYIGSDNEDSSKISKKHEFDDFVSNAKKRLNAISEEATKILSQATNASLAGGFEQQRKAAEEYVNSHEKKFMWAIGGIVILSFAFFIIILFSHIDLRKDYYFIYPPLAITLTALIWFGIAHNKKMNQYSRLEQDYAHKKAMAVSFEGYKAQIQELYNNEDEENMALLNKLLESNISEFSKNPSSALGEHNDSDHPYKLVLKTLKDMSKIESLARNINIKNEYEINSKSTDKNN